MLMTVEQAVAAVVLGSMAIGMWIAVRVPPLITRWLNRDRADSYQGKPKDPSRVKRNGH